MYCVPEVGVCVELVAMLCVEPTVQVSVCALLYCVPSTLNDRPAGLVPTVTWTVAWPVPLRGMVWVSPGAVLAFRALSVNVTDPVMEAEVYGTNSTLTLQLAPAASVVVG
jgi:hypothetical protein